MKKSKIFSVLFTLVLLLSLPLQGLAATSFTDVKGDFWAEKEISNFVDLGIVKGYPDKTFRPENTVTRGQAAIMIARGLKLDVSNVGAVSYEDIKDASIKEIAAVTKAGIMKGTNGKFEPNKPLTRAQMATILTNAFKLKGDGSTTFTDVAKDHYAYEAIDAIVSNKIATGLEDGSFKPEEATTRAQFVVFLSSALNKQTDVTEEPAVEEETEVTNEAITELLKEVYANELALNSYEFDGSMNLGLKFPKSLTSTPEDAAIFKMFEDIKVDIKGAYQKDPMKMEMTMDLTLQGEVETKFSIPMIMTTDKMWIKLPQSPLLPLPEELNGKYIELDLNELTELSGQPSVSMDLALQTEFTKAIYDIFFDEFGKYYEEVDQQSVAVPADIKVDKVLKFELSNEDLKPFIETLFNNVLPKFLTLLENPEYVKALGLTSEDIALLKEGLASADVSIGEVAGEISNFVDINELSEYIAINEDKYIGYDKFNLDITITMEGESLGLKLSYDLGKSKVNETVDFKLGTPKASEVIPFNKLMEIEAEAVDAVLPQK
ncbi:S-layer homology domain-containing protein [Lysinibacillus endophyticus]|uniref:S-layer homology domain-containing protein n=1 Tax=Ureibacillus endophyticus TaxID=1978490 RepID=UPI0020A0BB6C|nr:S-layer homology domain-containing protein [Lysinibacillus endophyticus]MCP1143350.1 S-layer homology domain-containing protein [Lysinibacillus endophyticus]